MARTLEERHRARKRKAEMEIALQHLTPYVKTITGNRLLEFGSGYGYQIPYLRKLGNLVASDIYQNERIKEDYPDVNFVVCDVRHAPFVLESFDLIFANHVLEHIENIKQAFSELKGIGRSDCIYAFTVPTDVWLLVSLPAQFYNGVRKIICRIFKKPMTGHNREISSTKIEGWRKFLPRGHGWRKGFFDCLSSFKIKNWKNLFCENGFEVIEVSPLLLYAPSEFPIIPTTRFLAKRGIYSSAIFIMKKQMKPRLMERMK